MDPLVAPPLPSLTVLVVDDEEANRRLLQKALERRGHRVVTAASGEEAVQRYAEAGFDLVLMDVMLPGWNGFETTRRLRAGGPAGRWVPLIFLSALSQVSHVVEGIAAGGDDYLAKPVDLALLEAKIAAMQRIALLQRELEGHLAQLRRYYEDNEERRQTAARLFERLMRHDRLPDDGCIRLHVQSTDGFSGDLAGGARSVDGRDYLLLADAAGHGLNAAINVLPAVDCFHALAERGYSLPRIAAAINGRLRQLLPPDRFVAALFACADPARGEIEVLNAGMPAALLIDGTAALRLFPSRHLALGVVAAESRDFVADTVAAAPGAQLFAFSDGLVEASAAGVAFGEERLRAALAVPAEDRFAAVLAALARHTGDDGAHDDVSLAQLTLAPAAPMTFPTEAPVVGDGRLAIDLAPAALRNPDLLPQLVQLAVSIGLLPAEAQPRLLVLLREAVGNAIDHGLLGLGPRAGSDPGVRAAERTTRLAALATGRVQLALHPENWQGRPAWRLEIADSGPGYPCDTPPPAGGGLARIAALALELRRDDEGRRLRAWFR